MAGSYGTYTMVRQLNRKITTTHISNDDVDALALATSKPITDAAFKGYGAPWTVLTDAPGIVKVFDALQTVATIFDDVFSQTADESGVAAKARERAWDLHTKFIQGIIGESGLTTPELFQAADASDARLDEEVFVDKGSHELDWEHTAETRESD